MHPPVVLIHCVGQGLGVAGNVRRAICLVSLACYSGTSCCTSTYNAVMFGLSKSGKENYLLVVLSRMLVEGCALDAETYSLLIKSMISLGCIDDCVLFFNLMASEGLLPDSEMLTNLLSFLAKQSQLHRNFPGTR